MCVVDRGFTRHKFYKTSNKKGICPDSPNDRRFVWVWQLFLDFKIPQTIYKLRQLIKKMKSSQAQLRLSLIFRITSTKNNVFFKSQKMESVTIWKVHFKRWALGETSLPLYFDTKLCNSKVETHKLETHWFRFKSKEIFLCCKTK